MDWTYPKTLYFFYFKRVLNESPRIKERKKGRNPNRDRKIGDRKPWE